MLSPDDLYQKVSRCERLTTEDALELALRGNFITLAQLAKEHSKKENGQRNEQHKTATIAFDARTSWPGYFKELQKLRDAQDELPLYFSFLPNAVSLTGHEYLRLIAITRLFLDNFEHIETPDSLHNSKIAEIALHFGASPRYDQAS